MFELFLSTCFEGLVTLPMLTAKYLLELGFISCSDLSVSLSSFKGKTATFKAVPSGEPKPEVTWRRAKGDMDDPKKFKFTYDKALNEYCLQVRE